MALSYPSLTFLAKVTHLFHLTFDFFYLTNIFVMCFVVLLLWPNLFKRQKISKLIALFTFTSKMYYFLFLFQGSGITFAGDIKVRRDERFTKEEHSPVDAKDSGDYTCEVETKDRTHPKSVVHK